MSLELGADPTEAGLDPGALESMAAHFDGYVADGRLPGWQVTVSRGGRLAWVGSGGWRVRAERRPVTDDTLWRIYSMTKPVFALLAMGLVDDGVLHLDDEASRWIPELAEPRVFVSGTPEEPVTRPAASPVLVRHLLSHTAGLTYGFAFRHPVDAIYRSRGHIFGSGYPGKDLAESVSDWCSTPLVADPGTRFNYSVAFDVLGRIIELATGRGLDAVMRERLLDPLGLSDTDWWCPPEKAERLAALELAPFLAAWEQFRIGDHALVWPRMLGGGGGLVSSSRDFERVMAVLLNRGELDGVRVVSPEGYDQMVANQLPGGLLEDLALDSYGEVPYHGMGYGFGQFVVVDAARAHWPMSAGSTGWGGAASTHYFVDPAEELTAAFYTQLLPVGTYPISKELGDLVAAARL